MARIASCSSALILLITWITRCNAVPHYYGATCHYVEKINYDTQIDEPYLTNTFDDGSIIEHQEPFIRRCSSVLNAYHLFFVAHCIPKCLEDTGECSLADKACIMTTDASLGDDENQKTAQAPQELRYREPVKEKPDDVENQKKPLQQLKETPSLEPVVEGRPDGHCHVFCGTSVRTFDGLTYSFPLRCRHFLASLPLYNVDFVTDFPCGNKTCKSTVSISYSTATVDLLPDGIVHVNKRRVNLPFVTANGITIFKEGVYVVCRAIDGTKVSFDGISGVVVAVNKLHESAWEATDAYSLCGTYDNDPTNDLRGHSVKEFADEILVPEDGVVCTKPGASLLNPFDNLNAVNKGRVLRACDEFATDQLFQHCRSLHNVQPFYNSCWFTLSLALLEGSSFDQSLCDVFVEYSSSCSRYGVPVEWRSTNFCPVACDHGMVNTECGSACPQTCETLFFHSKCGNECIPGCQCPPDTYFDGDACVAKESCPCPQAGESYPSGAFMRDGCRDCVCFEGKLQKCTTHACPATCTILGGRHFSTFDGKSYEYHSNCKHVLIQNAPVDSPAFGIFMAKTKCSDEEWQCNDVPEIIITTPDGTQYELLEADTVTVTAHNAAAAQELKLPYSRTADNSTITITRLSSVFTRASMPVLGIELMLGSDNRIYLSVTENLFGKVEGLCGTYNRITADDFQLPNGVVARVSHLFAPRWKSNSQCKNTRFEEILDYCEKKNSRRDEAENTCSQLTTEPFKDCGLKVDPKAYLEMCRDVRCKAPYYKGTECLAFAAYALECAKMGVVIDWTSQDLCPVTCKGGKVYKECGSVCKVSCRDLGNRDDCQEQCVQGCQCPNDMVFSERLDKCVPVPECPCHFNGRVHAPGTSWNNICNKCSCKNGVVQCTDKICTAAGEECTGSQENIECVECQRECQSLHLTCSETDCTPGCGCPTGTVRTADDQCMPESDCPCYFDGRSYEDLEPFRVDSTCRGYGEPHYMTYDDRHYEFQGDCNYVFTTDECGIAGRKSIFSVVVENVPCGAGQVACTKSVLFTLLDLQISMVRGSDIVITPAPPAPTEAKYSILHSGIFFIINTKHGITVVWDFGMSVYVTLDGTFKGQVCGLCGDFDKNAQNDFRTRTGELEATANAFGHSWKTIESCPLPPAPVHPCDLNPERREWAESACSIITESGFASCHDYADPKPFYDNCVFDSCGCNRGGDCECMCTAVSNYAAVCAILNAPVPWRSDGNCGLQCDNGMEYQACGKVCPDKCYETPQEEDNGCEMHCVEGCHCPEGTKLWKGECVDDIQCPCMYNNQEVEPGFVIIEDCRRCECIGGNITCSGSSCTTPLCQYPFLTDPDGQTARNISFLKELKPELVWVNNDTSLGLLNGKPYNFTADIGVVQVQFNELRRVTAITVYGDEQPEDTESAGSNVDEQPENSAIVVYRNTVSNEDIIVTPSSGAERFTVDWEAPTVQKFKDSVVADEIRLIIYDYGRGIPYRVEVYGCPLIPSTTVAVTTTAEPPSAPQACPLGLELVAECKDCRDRVCHDGNCYEVVIAKPLEKCCECSHGAVFNGSECVHPKHCQCVDASGKLRQVGELTIVTSSYQMS
ncbi:SCO-spondin-like [Patiria miniata]|uniref:VWFD domain-containing protein n=1 Tax=Patiria miniata TaxID=46514 RepID=A0A913YZT3_PATMI|nr:SCO-spondin-like [Patiria miniata]